MEMSEHGSTMNPDESAASPEDPDPATTDAPVQRIRVRIPFPAEAPAPAPADASTTASGAGPGPGSKPRFITDPMALLKLVKRLRDANDNLAYRTSGGLRIMIRNDPDDAGPGEVAFDVSVVIDDESPEIVKAIQNEIDIMEDDSGCIVIEDYAFSETDGESLKSAVKFLNSVDTWTVCPCGEYLIKDAFENAEATMCYYCECTREAHETLEHFCPICHDIGCARWMITVPCCNQKMHRKCQQACIVSASIRHVENKCPMCCQAWN